MLEPRIPKPSYVPDESMTFIGGTADFDLWIDNYIQCFAPWVLGYSLTKQGHGDG